MAVRVSSKKASPGTLARRRPAVKRMLEELSGDEGDSEAISALLSDFLDKNTKIKDILINGGVFQSSESMEKLKLQKRSN